MSSFTKFILTFPTTKTLIKILLMAIMMMLSWEAYRYIIMKPIIISTFFNLNLLHQIKILEFSFFLSVSFFINLFIQLSKFRNFKEDGNVAHSDFDILMEKIDELGEEIKIAEKAKDAMFHELLCKRRMLREIIDSLPLFVFAKYSDGRFFIVNKAVADCYGTHPREMIGKTDADFSDYPSEVLAFMSDDMEVIRSQRPKRKIEEKITCCNGKSRILLTDKIPLKSWDGKSGVLGISFDMTNLYDAIAEADNGHCHKNKKILKLLEKMRK